MKRAKKVIVVMPAYNAEKTLERTLDDIPRDWVDEIILVDDGSRDGTVALARSSGLRVFVHEKNRGYGGNQKTCYTEALKLGGDIMVMVHPDHQYDPTVIPQLVQPLLDGACDAVFGSRMLGGRPLEGGMPKWKYLANIFLTALENATFYMYLTEYHPAPGLFPPLSRDREFHGEFGRFRFRFRDHRPGRRCMGCGSARSRSKRAISRRRPRSGFGRSIVYGLSILKTLVKFKLHKKGLVRYRMFG